MDLLAQSWNENTLAPEVCRWNKTVLTVTYRDFNKKKIISGTQGERQQNKTKQKQTKEWTKGGGGRPLLPLPLHPSISLSSTFMTDSRGNACYAGTLVPLSFLGIFLRLRGSPSLTGRKISRRTSGTRVTTQAAFNGNPFYNLTGLLWFVFSD